MSFNILLVDDSKIMREVIAKTLRLADVPVCELQEAENGKDALAILSARWIDLVLTDINMPVMGGMELIDKMSENGLLRTIPVIVISTEGSVTRIEQLRAKGISAYLRKPFTPETLRRVIYDVVGLSDAG